MAFQGAIFDVDGVLVDSPHELAWRESLRLLMETEWREVRDQTTWTPERFTPGVYQQVMSGMPRMAGARAALEHFGVPEVEARAEQYAAAKQEQIVGLIEEGRFMAFPDALRFILAVKAAGIQVAAASSSKNAKLFLERIRLDTFAAEQRLDYDFIRPRMTLEELFDADISGRDFPRGKPDPAIFLTAAAELGCRPTGCFVVEDASSGVQAAKAGDMAALGVARLDDRDLLVEAGADLVVPTLDDVSMAGLALGRLEERRAAAELRRRHTERPPSVWALVYDGFDPGRQGLREALCAVGNGYFVTRGALPEAGADDVNYPGTYVAGLYNRATTEIAGRAVENEDLINVPNWLPLSFRVADGPWFDVQQAGLLDHRLELDLRQGTLTRWLRWQDAEGRRTQVTQRRFVSMKDQHLAGLETTFVAENWSGTIQVRSGLDGRVVNAGVKRYRDLNGRHLTVLHAGEADADTVELQVETNQSRVRVALAARTRLLRDGQVAEAERRLISEPGFVAHDLGFELDEGRPATVEKVVALYTSRDRAISESLLEARQAAQAGAGIAELLARHEGTWAILWDRFDIELDSANEWAETVLHLHIFHLLQTVSPHTLQLDAGVPARGWHGEAYRGHVFWDEMFIFPFFNLQRPVLAAALLDYRHVRMPAARAAAREAGLKGAMFPWQSGSNGREETQRLHLNPKSGRWLPDHSHLQRHVNIAVAYNAWQHYQVTGSTGWLRFVGAELLIEIARFWSSITTWNADEGRYEILGVMGPDEYHEAYPDADRPGLDNNTYHQRDGRLGAAAGPGGAGGAPPALPPGAGHRAVDRGCGAGPLARHRPQDEGRVPRRRGPEPVRGLRGPAGVRLGGLPGALRRHRPAGPAAGGRGRQPQPLQAVQAGGRADAAVPAVPEQAAGAAGRARLPGQRGAAGPHGRLLPGQDLAWLDPLGGGERLGAGPLPARGGLAVPPARLGERRRRRPGRHHRRRHPPWRDGRDRRHRAALPDRPQGPRSGAAVRPGPAAGGQAAQVQRPLPRPPGPGDPHRGPPGGQLATRPGPARPGPGPRPDRRARPRRQPPVLP
jgi:beta-phosphoglucomutase-like phosphatase (HAD superfamily)